MKDDALNANEASESELQTLGELLLRLGIDGTSLPKLLPVVNRLMKQEQSPEEVSRIVRDIGLTAKVVPLPERHLRLVNARDLWPPRPPDWFLRPYIPRAELTLLEGREGVGKGLFAAWLAKQVAAGELGEAKAVVWFSAEDDPQHTVVPRLHAAGWSPGHHADIEFLDSASAFVLPSDESLLRERLCREDVGLVVFDPVKSFAGSISGYSAESSNDMYVRRVTQPLSRVAQEFDVTVVMIGHWRKGADLPSEDRSHGSVAWRAVPRAVVQLAQAPDGSGAVWLDKCNVSTSGHLHGYEIQTVEIDIDSGRWHRFPRLVLTSPLSEFQTLDAWMAAKRQEAQAERKASKVDLDQFTDWLLSTYAPGDRVPDRDGLFNAAFLYFTPQLLDLKLTDVRRFMKDLVARGNVEYRPGKGNFVVESNDGGDSCE